MTKKLIVGIVFRVLALLSVVIPFVISLVVAVLLNHFLGWEGRAGLMVLAGVALSVAMGVAMFWFLDDCNTQIHEWINSVGQKKAKSKPEAGTWKADV